MKFKRLRLKKTFNGNLKAVSPVIATIIIVAIAITMSIAVAYWLLGLGSSFTKFEKVEFTSAYVTGSGVTGDAYTIHFGIKNTGSAAATVDPISTMYNGKPDTYYVTGTAPTFVWTGDAITSLQPGAQANYIITLPVAGANGLLANGVQGFSSGMTLEITLHTTGGKDYPKVVTLP